MYAMVNKLLERWLETRSGNHPFAAFPLMLVAAMEASYHLHAFAGYLRSDFTHLTLQESLKRSPIVSK